MAACFEEDFPPDRHRHWYAIGKREDILGMRLSSKHFLRLFRYGLFLGLLPAMLIGAVLCLYTYNNIMQNLHGTTKQSLLQIQMRVEQMLQMQDRQLFNFLTDPATVELMTDTPTTRDFQKIQKVRSNLGKNLIYDLGINDCILVSLRDDWFLDVSGMARYSTLPGREYYQKILERAGNMVWVVDFDPKTISSPRATTRWAQPETVKLVRAYPINGRYAEGYASISVPCTVYSQLLGSDEFSENILIVDADGTIVTGKNQTFPGVRLADTTYADAAALINDSAEQSGVVNSTDNTYMYAYSRSSYNQWSYLYIVDMQTACGELLFLRNIIFGLGAVILLGVFAVALVKAWSIYRPVNNLYTRLAMDDNGERPALSEKDEFRVINQRLEALMIDRKKLGERVMSQSQIGQELMVRKLLNGEMGCRSLADNAGVAQFSPCPEQCRLALVQIDSLDDTPYTARDRDWLMLALCNIGSEWFAEYLCLPVVVDGGNVAMVLGTNEPDSKQFKTDLSERLKGFQAIIRQHIHIDISIGVSGLLDGYHDLARASSRTRSMFHYHILNSQDGLMFAEDIREPLGAHPQFPLSLEENVLDALNRCDSVETDRALAEFIHEVLHSDETIGGCYLAFTRMLVDILRVAQEFEMDHLLPDPATGVFEQLFSMKTEQQVFQWFKNNFIDPLLELIQQKTSLRETKYYRIMKEMAETRYGEYLSVEVIAEQLSINPSYLRRVFRGATGMGFNTYLTNCRIDAAKHLLTETDMRVSDIAEKLTYQNSQNFIRIFRKITGITPGEYRKLKR